MTMRRSRQQVDRVEQRMFEYLSENHDLTFATTEKYARLDGILMKNNLIHRVAEVKVRWMSLDALRKFGSYLISYDKLIAGQQASEAFSAPFVILLYLVESDNICSIKMTNEKGQFITSFTKQNETTYYDMNGGRIERVNAYVSLNRLKIIK